MIALTGDIHHMSLKTLDQRFLPITEPQAALEYAQIAAEHGLKVTLFATGKALVEESRVFQELASLNNVELGGHGYYAAHPRWLYGGVFRRILKQDNGPAFYQEWEIKRTIRAFRSRLGLDISSWRDHSYMRDANTYRLLSKCGISIVSDEVDPDVKKPHPVHNNLYSLSLNVPPDHDHLYHGIFTPNTAKARALGRGKFPLALYQPEEWLTAVEEQVTQVLQCGGVAAILAHPTCMKIADDFSTFRRLCEYLSRFETIFARESASLVQERS